MGNTPRRMYPRSALRRIVYGILGIAVVMIVGVVGFEHIEHMSLVNAIYFESMIATGQGPPYEPATTAGKLFASAMAFVSVGSVITTLLFTLAPVLATVWREVLERTEDEARRIDEDVRGKKAEPEGEKA